MTKTASPRDSPRPGRGAPGGARPAGARRLRVLAAIVAISLLLPAAAAAGPGDAPAPAQPADAPAGAQPGAPPPQSSEPPPGLLPISLDNVVGAVDRTHETVTAGLEKTVQWFDSFFSDRRFLDEGTPESQLRLRTGVRFRERDGARYLARIHASLALPGTERRLRLILEGRGEQEQTAVLPVDPTAPEFDTGKAEQGSLQALYEFTRRHDINLSLRGGVRFHFPVDPFVKLRFRYSHALGTRSLVRLTQEEFVTVQEGPGETTRIDFERQLAHWTVLRWSISGTLAESNPGYEWGSELSVFRQLTDRTAVTFETGLSAQVEPAAAVTNYVTRIRFRQNVFRPWFFYEVEPELSWPREASGAYPPAWGVTLLVEVQFGKSHEAPSPGTRPAAPAADREPGQPAVPR
ncbi:MAG: hypothetical protein ACM3NF_07775 [Gemmatimonadota bacterium]